MTPLRRNSAHPGPRHPPPPPAGDPMDSIDDRIAAAPLPTPATLKQRTSIPIQLIRFAVINLRMIKMVRKGHG